MAKIRFNRNFDIGHIVKRLVYTVLALYVGGTIMTTFGDVMNATYSPFYNGLSLIGWTVSSSTGAGVACPTTLRNNCITSTSGSGVLAVVGIIGIAGVVMEFVTWN